jgi:magnesium chelatase family protein
MALLARPPMQAPHHTASAAAIVGGGSGIARPGAASLAHHGVLFLDELPEFKRDALEALRQPLEDRRITIVRARTAVSFPASFQLVAALNPCPCGYRGSSLRACVCPDDRVRRYLARLSGPLLDRIDLHVEVPHVDYRALRAERDGEPSSAVRDRVMVARDRQRHRLGRARSNALLNPRELRDHCRLGADADQHLERCVKAFALGGRAVHRILRVARTIADLAGGDRIVRDHVAEAINLRVLDRAAA